MWGGVWRDKGEEKERKIFRLFYLFYPILVSEALLKTGFYFKNFILKMQHPCKKI